MYRLEQLCQLEYIYVMSQTGTVRRRPETGGYARGEETRERIIAAAVKVFGEEGYLRASTRQIATEAGVNAPALQYYFNGKEGLHRACAQVIVDRVMTALKPALAAAEAAAASDDQARAADAFCDVLDAVADLYGDTSDAAGWRRFMARGQVDREGPAMTVIQDGVADPLQKACERLTAVALGRACAPEEIRLRTVLLLGQLTVLHSRNESLRRIMGWTSISPAELAQIKAATRNHTRAVLGFATST